MSNKKKIDLTKKLLQGSLEELDNKEAAWLKDVEINDVMEYRTKIDSAKEYMENLFGRDLSALQEAETATMSMEI